MPSSQYDRPEANRVFTNREKPIALFNAARTKLAPGQHHILTFYGVGGQGKTELRKKLAQILTDEDPRQAVWGVLDLDVFNRAERGLLELRKTLRRNGHAGSHVHFTAFDIAIAVYWEKAHPTEDIRRVLKDLLEDNEGVLSAIADNAPAWLEMAESLPAGLGLGVKILLLARKKLKENAAKRQIEALHGIEQLDIIQLLDKLPYFLAIDLRIHRERDAACQLVLFLDTYESLWSDKPDKTGLAAVETDAWVRELVAAAQGVLFVIFGRDPLSWPDGDWAGCLDQHRLNGLSAADADQFLRQIPIAEADIRAAIIEAAQGQAEADAATEAPGAHPFYLDLAANRYLDMRAAERQPKPADFGGTRSEIIACFLRHRSLAEQETLKLLAGSRAFDRELFVALIKRFQTGYPPTAWAEFTGFSFIETGSDQRQRLHGLMRDHLRTALNLNQDSRAELQVFLFDWFDARCRPTSPKEVNASHEWALREAVYQRDLTNTVAALNWFWKRWQVFYDAAHYVAIESLNRWAVELAEKQLGANSPASAIAFNNLAAVLLAINQLTEAEPLMRRALEIDEGNFGPQFPYLAIRLNNLAQLLIKKNRLLEAEPLLRRALQIDIENFGPNHPNVANDLNNLAQLLKTLGRMEDAEPLMWKALEIDEANLEANHPNIARDLSNLTVLMKDTGRIPEAEPRMRRVLKIDEDRFGPNHPSVARDLSNLAMLLRDTHRAVEAKPLMERALEIDESIYGSEHPEVAIDINNLALLLQDTNQQADAEALIYRALEIDEQNFGSEHPNVAIRLSNLALLLHNINRQAEAEPLMRRAVVILLKFTQATGHEHPHLRRFLNNYLGLLQALPTTQADFAQCLISLGAEAHWDADEWRGWLEQSGAHST